jgi:MurNAc alpha-1-phosphate uridylyltransferase
MGLQRHIKVLGIFCRLWYRDGKKGYLDDLPLVWHYTREVGQPLPRDGAAGRADRARAGRTRHPRAGAMTRALVFAAGKGERMRPLTNDTPKPLLRAGGKRLVEWHLEKLAAAGVREVVLNIAWLADRFEPALGDGSRWGLHLHYSHEGAEPLETGGGMLHALRILGDAPFICINGDTWSDYDFARLPTRPRAMAHLVVVDNPPQHPRGRFPPRADGTLRGEGEGLLTFSASASTTRASCWAGAMHRQRAGTELQPPRFKLAPLLFAAMARGEIHGEHHRGRWTDVGTPERLADLDASSREPPRRARFPAP